MDHMVMHTDVEKLIVLFRLHTLLGRMLQEHELPLHKFVDQQKIQILVIYHRAVMLTASDVQIFLIL